MSYFEDFEEDRLGDIEYSDFEHYTFLQEPRIKYTFQRCQNKWIMKNGQEIDIRIMETTHIINSLNMVLKICRREGWNPNNYSIYNKLRRELENRKDRGGMINEFYR